MKILRNRRVSFKLLLLVLPIILTSLYILLQFSIQTNKVNDEARKIYYDTLFTNSDLILNADRDYYQAELAEKTLELSGKTLDQETKDSLVKDYNDNCSQVLERINSAKDNIVKDQELYSEFKESNTQLTFAQIYEQFTTDFDKWKSLYDPATGKGDSKAKGVLFETTRDKLNTITELLEQYSDTAKKDVKDYIAGIITNTIVIIAAAFLIVLVLIVYIIRYLGSNIGKLTDNMNALADNNLSFEVHVTDSTDELGKLSNSIATLVYSLRDIVTRLVKTSEQLSIASHTMKINSDEVTASMNEIAKTVGEIAEGATNQAEDAQQLVHEITNLGEEIDKSTESAKGLAGSSREIMAASQEGMASVNELENITQNNQTAFQSIFTVIDTTNNNAGRIKEASTMISDIAKKTKLLALNASIEAASAGTAGKGFAVVAEEIRRLSEQSTKATMDIDDILKELSDNIHTASMQSKTVRDAVKLQATSVSETKEKYLAIANVIDNINQEIMKLDDISKNMEKSRAAVSDFASNVSAISQEYAASTQETSATTEEVLAAMTNINQIGVEVSNLVIEVKGMIEKFKLDN